MLAALALGTALAQPEYQEAPGLAARVEAGEMPPVGERLPQNPLVVEPNERVGQYGGTWRMGLVGGSDGALLTRTIGHENLMRWDPAWEEVIPNIAESYEVSADSTTYTFRLREGMRWSDGEPFTADDIMFWYEDVLLNETLTPAPSAVYTAGDEVVTVEKVDDHTVRFTFAVPNGLFLQNLASPVSAVTAITSYPRHYAERFHEAYNPDVDALVKEAGAEDWVGFFESKVGPSGWAQNPEMPTLYPWVVSTGYGESTTRVVAERNPYYFKVDPEGNQLPYLDRVLYTQFQESEVLLLSALAGEIDMQERHLNTLSNKAVLTDNMAVGNYGFFDVIPDASSAMTISLNLTHRDPVKREVFQNKDFRIGLSHAINRAEIIDLIYVGQGEPFQPAPRPETELYSEELAKQYTEYDVALANEHLDRAFPEKDAEGFRLGPDGRRITFVVETFSGPGADTLELVRGYWREVGIDAQVRESDRSLVTTRMESNEHDAVMYFGGGGLKDAFLDGRWYLPSYNWESAFAPAWAFWYLRAPGGEEPPEAVREQFRLWDAIRATADEAEQVALMEQVLEIAADQFYAIGIASTVPGIGIVKNNFHNVPDSMPSTGGAYNAPGPTNPEQYFISSSAP